MDEIRLADGVSHYVFAAFIIEPEIVLRVEDTDNVINIFAAYRENRVACAVNGLLPCFDGVAAPEDGNVRAVSADLLGCHVVECENVFDDAVFVLVDSAFFGSGVGHHHYFLLGDGVLLLFGVYPENTQDKIGRGVEYPHGIHVEGSLPRALHKADDSRHFKSQGLGVFHRHALGDELAEYEREIREYQRYKHDCCRSYDLRGDVYPAL